MIHVIFNLPLFFKYTSELHTLLAKNVYQTLDYATNICHILLLFCPILSCVVYLTAMPHLQSESHTIRAANPARTGPVRSRSVISIFWPNYDNIGDGKKETKHNKNLHVYLDKGFTRIQVIVLTRLSIYILTDMCFLAPSPESLQY